MVKYESSSFETYFCVLNGTGMIMVHHTTAIFSDFGGNLGQSAGYP